MAATLLESLVNQLGGNTASQIGAQLGADPAAAQSAIGAALPVLIGALAKNAASPDGATALGNALSKDHDGSILNDIAGAVTGYQSGAGAGILKHVLGAKKENVAEGLGRSTGLSAAQAGSLLTMLAPLVLGALGKAQRSGGLDAGGLAAALGNERKAIEAGSGSMGGLLSMLDADKDGSVLDDVLGMAAKFMGRKTQ